MGDRLHPVWLLDYVLTWMSKSYRDWKAQTRKGQICHLYNVIRLPFWLHTQQQHGIWKFDAPLCSSVLASGDGNEDMLFSHILPIAYRRPQQIMSAQCRRTSYEQRLRSFVCMCVCVCVCVCLHIISCLHLVWAHLVRQLRRTQKGWETQECVCACMRVCVCVCVCVLATSTAGRA